MSVAFPPRGEESGPVGEPCPLAAALQGPSSSAPTLGPGPQRPHPPPLPPAPGEAQDEPRHSLQPVYSQVTQL